MNTPEQRAVQVITSNKYLVLATSDSRGPWAAALAFTLLDGGRLAFVSLRSSRHGSSIGDSSKVAGVIFDSRAETSDVESVQFEGTCIDVGDSDSGVRELLTAGGACDGEAVSDTEVANLSSDPEKGVYVISMESIYVLDQMAWEERQVDARELVNRDQLLAALSTSSASHC